MTFDQALDHFGSCRAIGDALGVSISRVSQLRSAGGFSYQAQCVLEKASSGKLQALNEDVPKKLAA
ncbi:hypothetical protein [Pseudomonas multiresinivorans]|uniref:DNA-binding protein n=1 Tax=Pseudomonas multiresinivorans TaxID=95301 RepID=A0A7Z3BP88_9PSED|nr:hypothetical protein [Pseudomonas multiresinivorans]QJP10482.1 hypothetical protein G4G71_22290 [Pseudomonas multiresinivorans]